MRTDDRSFFMSDCLVPEPVEGGQTLAGELLRTGGPWLGVLCGDATPGVKGWAPLIGQGLIPWRALRALRRGRPDRLTWLPNGGLTYLMLVRLWLVHLVVPRAAIDLVLLQRPRTPHARVVRPMTRYVSVSTLNSADCEALGALGLRTALLDAPTPPDRISDLDQATARAKLGLPAEGAVFLHAGHATRRRNLHALGPLAEDGLLMLVLSPYTKVEPDSLPTGESVRIVSGRVEVANYYRAADVYVFPTIEHNGTIGLPMSIAEALGNGLPVVARRSDMTARWSADPRVTLVDSDDELVGAARRLAHAARS